MQTRLSRFKRLLGDLLDRHPWDEGFIEEVRERVAKRCAALPVHVYKIRDAELRLEETARGAIVEVFQENFDDAWFPIKVRKDWPVADCIISPVPELERHEAVIRIAFSPETSALMGGDPIDAIRVPVNVVAPNIVQKTLNRIFKARKAAPPELAPVGTPDGRKELHLTRKVDAPKQEDNRPAQPAPANPRKAKMKPTFR